MHVGVWVNFGEDFFVDLHGALDAEGVQIENFVKWNLGIVQLNFIDFALGVFLSDFGCGGVELLSVAKVDFVEENLVSEANLLDSFILATLLSVFFKS